MAKLIPKRGSLNKVNNKDGSPLLPTEDGSLIFGYEGFENDDQAEIFLDISKDKNSPAKRFGVKAKKAYSADSATLASTANIAKDLTPEAWNKVTQSTVKYATTAGTANIAKDLTSEGWKKVDGKINSAVANGSVKYATNAGTANYAVNAGTANHAKISEDLTKTGWDKVDNKISNALVGGMRYKGVWNKVNLPADAKSGDTYKIGEEKSYQFDSGLITCKVGDTIIFDGTKWELIPSGDDGNLYADGNFISNRILYSGENNRIKTSNLSIGNKSWYKGASEIESVFIPNLVITNSHSLEKEGQISFDKVSELRFQSPGGEDLGGLGFKIPDSEISTLEKINQDVPLNYKRIYNFSDTGGGTWLLDSQNYKELVNERLRAEGAVSGIKEAGEENLYLSWEGERNALSSRKISSPKEPIEGERTNTFFEYTQTPTTIKNQYHVFYFTWESFNNYPVKLILIAQDSQNNLSVLNCQILADEKIQVSQVNKNFSDLDMQIGLQGKEIGSQGTRQKVLQICVKGINKTFQVYASEPISEGGYNEQPIEIKPENYTNSIYYDIVNPNLIEELDFDCGFY